MKNIVNQDNQNNQTLFGLGFMETISSLQSLNQNNSKRRTHTNEN